MGEFDLIDRYFKDSASRRFGEHKSSFSSSKLDLNVAEKAKFGQIDLGIGDDCALFTPAAGMQLAVSSDMLVEGRHFLSTVSPEALGHKALAVNLSDLAACGAKPLAFTLALALPSVDQTWLEGFSRGMLALAHSHDIALIGGDTTKGPLNICITVFGQVPKGKALLRSGAKVGDDIYVSGCPGRARLALEVFRGNISLPQSAFETARQAMERPTPRVALGLALQGLATSCIDVSDGLLGDLEHVLKQSQVAAEIDLYAIDSIAVCAYSAGIFDGFDIKSRRKMLLSGGDDYELMFTAPQNQRENVQAAALAVQTPVTRIGKITQGQGAKLLERDGSICQDRYESFDHFK